ncbi:hypothetical protein Xen7305DRAFT_00019790 [Xenococcus sp. PCC 7305]|uniref:DUF1338 domain-containing protein n=1 Tax=Xenococcus sp. PCC 7305 TaxID=102125 RepID=UPI0002ACDFA3|nr:DUF1338 domain-containing protein [Xenococcus sp. PCC 7305]ELS02266.1 hypothetical protein Xen7305DRAFT_00019790 [Xenococcus sp. PCC 7305]
MNSPYLAQELWAQLWEIYRQRVSYAQIYETMIQDAGGMVANDHIAFRSLRLIVDSQSSVSRSVNLGIPYLEKIVKWLGYEVAGEYEFRDRNLYARHYRHPAQDELDLPKLFISELIVEQLPPSLILAIQDTVRSGSFFDPSSLQQSSLASEKDYKKIAQALVPVFTSPWLPPKRTIVEAVNKVSQYGAWVLLHGYGVNHFTAYINRQNTPTYPDIETTAQALASQDVPMKDSFEGGPTSGLKQTATHAVVEPVTVLDEQGEPEQILWSYAYYELAQRYFREDKTGKKSLFEGFIAPQAQNLFDMTKAIREGKVN